MVAVWCQSAWKMMEIRVKFFRENEKGICLRVDSVDKGANA